MKKFLLVLLISSFSFGFDLPDLTYSFSAGQLISASRIMQNYNDILNAIKGNNTISAKEYQINNSGADVTVIDNFRNITASDVTVTGDMTIQGDTYISGNYTVSGNFTVSNADFSIGSGGSNQVLLYKSSNYPLIYGKGYNKNDGPTKYPLLKLEVQDIEDEEVRSVVELRRTTINSPDIGFGSSIDSYLSYAGVTDNLVSRIATVADDIALENGSLEFSVVSSDALVKKVEIDGDGLEVFGVMESDTASVNSISISGSPQLKVQIFDIGVWDMDTTLEKIVYFTSNITSQNVRSISIMIRSDNYDLSPFCNSVDSVSPAYEVSGFIDHMGLEENQIELERNPSGVFDSTLYNDGSMNRGFVTIWYEE